MRVSDCFHIFLNFRNIIMGIHFSPLIHLVEDPTAKVFIMLDAELVKKRIFQQIICVVFNEK